MKKFIVLIFILTAIISSAFATSDYDLGYLEGYLDGYEASQNGEINEVFGILDEIDTNQLALGVWDLNYFVDDFGDDTDFGFISTPDFLYGIFSNKEATNEEFSAFFLIEEDYVTMKLFEYTSYQVNGSETYPTEYEVAIKCDGKIYYFTASNFSDRLEFSPSYDFINLLRKERPITMSIKEKSFDYGATYLLKDIETKGFNEAMRQLSNR